MPLAIPIDEDGKQVLVPAVAADGSPLSQEAALAQYQASGQHYGKFDTAENALAYAAQLPPPAPAAAAPAPPDTVSPAAPAPGGPAAPAAGADTGIPGVDFPYGGTPAPGAPGGAVLAAAPGTQPTIQPIPTGEPPVPGAQPVPAAPPPNRSGLPMPDEAWRRIQADPTLHNDAERAQAFAHAETIYRTTEAALSQQERIRMQAEQQQLRDAENEIFADVYSASPKIGPRQIAVDPRFNSDPTRRKSMIELVNNPPGSGIPAPQSYLAAQSLIDRMRLPQGDPNKITSRDQIYDQMRSLNSADLDLTLKKYDELSAPGNSRFSHRLEEFFKGVTPQIDKSGALPGLPSDARGKAKTYEFERFVEDQVDQYKKAGKNPDDLLNPKKPEYLGGPETLKPYKRTLTQALDDFNADYGKPDGVSPADVATPDALKAAVAGGKITRDQGEAEALRRGWIRPPQPGATAPVATSPGPLPATPLPPAPPPAAAPPGF